MAQHTVLVVEDNSTDALMIHRAFKKANITAALEVVADGDEAVAYLAGQGNYADRTRHPWPVLVLLDLKLPRRSGLEVLQWRRGQTEPARVPVVVLTSSRESEDIRRAYDAGANSYLVKPVDFDPLLEMVRSLGLFWLVHNQPAEFQS
jgi:DNA-binding response OmpR family regulator